MWSSNTFFKGLPKELLLKERLGEKKHIPERPLLKAALPHSLLFSPQA